MLTGTNALQIFLSTFGRTLSLEQANDPANVVLCFVAFPWVDLKTLKSIVREVINEDKK